MLVAQVDIERAALDLHLDAQHQALPANQFEQFRGEAEVERVFAAEQKLVIVDPPLTPILGLLAQDVELRTRRCPVAPPENAARVWAARSEIRRGARGRRGQAGVIMIEGCLVVIPMDGQRDRVSDQGAQKCLRGGSDLVRHAGHGRVERGFAGHRRL